MFLCQDKNPSFPPCFHSPLASFMTKSVSLLCLLLPLSHTSFLLAKHPTEEPCGVRTPLPEAAALLGSGCYVLLACWLYAQPPVNII